MLPRSQTTVRPFRFFLEFSVPAASKYAVAFSGRAVAAMAAEAQSDLAALDALSGTIQWTAELALRHGLTDENGRQPLSGRALRKVTGLPFLPASWVVPWFVLRWLSPRYPSVQSKQDL